MSIPVINPDALPVIPLWARRLTYALFLLAWAVVTSIRAWFADEGQKPDPPWVGDFVGGSIRVLVNLGAFVSAVALLNARQSATEAAKAKLDAQDRDYAGDVAMVPLPSERVSPESAESARQPVVMKDIPD